MGKNAQNTSTLVTISSDRQDREYVKYKMMLFEYYSNLLNNCLIPDHNGVDINHLFYLIESV